MKAAVVLDGYPWVTAALALLFVLICVKVGPAAIAPGLVFALIWSRRAVRSAWTLETPVEVSVGPEGLEIDGELRLPSSALRAGCTVSDPRGGVPFVVLERTRGPRLRLRMRTARDERNLLGALGLAAPEKAVTLRLLCGPLTIGVDGLSGPRYGGGGVFVPSEDIADVSTYETPRTGQYHPAQRGVVVVLHDGSSVRIPVSEGEDDFLQKVVVERILGCIELVAERLGHEGDNEAIARRGRKGPDWLRGLRASLNGGYRTVAADRSDLSRILDDKGAKLSARAAAAIALASSGDAEAATKLRVEAETLANPRVRVALESIAAMSDDGAMAEALEVLDDTEQQERIGHGELGRTEDQLRRNDGITS